MVLSGFREFLLQGAAVDDGSSRELEVLIAERREEVFLHVWGYVNEYRRWHRLLGEATQCSFDQEAGAVPEPLRIGTRRAVVTEGTPECDMEGMMQAVHKC